MFFASNPLEYTLNYWASGRKVVAEVVSVGVQNRLATAVLHYERYIRSSGQWIAEAAKLFASASIRGPCPNRPSLPFPQTMRRPCPRV